MDKQNETTQIIGIHYRTNEPVTLLVKDGKIAEIHNFAADLEKKAFTHLDESLPWIAPGLVDLQINGYKGFHFTTLPIELDAISRCTSELLREGVTSYFPTVTTNTAARIEEAVNTIAKACFMYDNISSSIAGIHLEGPFISPEDGPRGAHGLENVQAPDWNLFLRWQEAAEGRIKIVTISPEWPDSASFIHKCTESGVIVSIGHTAATPEQIREAVAAGARMSTHFGNGAHLMLPRHPNYLWEQLAQDPLWTCFIADGFHLPESVIKVVLKVKGRQSMMISDASRLSGMPPGEYVSQNGIRAVKTKEGKLHLAENPNLLAGSAQMLPWGIGHLVRNQICSLPDAWDMASVRPSEFMNLPGKEGLHAGSPADLVLFKWEDEQIRILQTFKQGRPSSMQAQYPL